MRFRVISMLALGAVLITGCGGDDGDGDLVADDTPAPSPTVSKSPTSETSQEPGTEREVITLDNETQLIFDYTDDPDSKIKTLAILRYAQYEEAVAKASLTRGEDESWKEYVAPQGHQPMLDYLEFERENNTSVIGTKKFYQFRVDVTGTDARLSMCVDESKWFARDLETGEAIKTPVTEKSYDSIRAVMEGDSAAADWILESKKTTDADPECQP